MRFDDAGPRPTRTRRSRRRLAVVALALLPLLVLLPAFAIAYAIVHPPRRSNERNPSALGLPSRDLTFNSTDGVRLSAWYLSNERSRGTVVVCHGYPGNRSEMLDYIRFLHRDFSVLAFDFRALGDSDGDLSTIGYREIRDALGAVAHLRSNAQTRSQPIGILGTSMGGAVALMATAQSREICAVVSDSAFASLNRVNEHHARELGIIGALLGGPERWFQERLMGVKLSQVSPRREIASISPRPVLIIHGSDDRFVPMDNAELLFGAAREPKQLWIVDGGSHVGSFTKERDDYEQRVTTFFKRAFMKVGNQ